MSAPLARRQRDFAAWLTAPAPPAALPGLLGDARASAAQRLHVYRHAYRARLLSVLRDDYPALAAALGEDSWRELADAYVGAQPSQHPSLRHFGARLPAFAAEHAAAEALRARAPWAADLARLELAITDAFDAADARALARSDLATLAPAAWDELPLALVPALRRLALAWPVRALRAAHDAAALAPLPALAPAAERVLVWRRDERVLHRACDAEEDALLGRVAAGGLRFGALCAALAQAHGDEAGVALAARWLARWVDDGLLVAPS